MAIALWLAVAACTQASGVSLEKPATEKVPVTAEEKTKLRVPQTESPALPAKLKLGVGIRARIDIRPFDANANGQRQTSAHLSFDTLILTADYESAHIFGSAQYRFYGANFLYSRSAGYAGIPGEVNFPVYAYIGTKLTPTKKVTLGLQPVPFDDRYWGSSWYDSLGFVYGMEEVYNPGITASHNDDRISIDAGYFPVAGPPGFGRSADSARFSVNIVKGDPYLPSASRNAERDMAVGRIQYRLPTSSETKITLSGSAWFSAIHNFDTGRNGHRRIFAASIKGEYGPWHAKLLGVRQRIDVYNSDRSDLVTVGDYDSSYNIAARGRMVFGEIGRQIETGSLPFKLNVYTSYARFIKDAAGFHDTQRVNVGAFWTDKANGSIRVWSEGLIGRNDPYVGAGQFGSGAAQGGDDKWKASLLIMMGYYF